VADTRESVRQAVSAKMGGKTKEEKDADSEQEKQEIKEILKGKKEDRLLPPVSPLALV